jgi:hypothetical protein
MRANLVRLYRINSAFSIGAASLAFGCALAAPAAAQSVGITINGSPVDVEPAPIVQAGRVFVPLRGVFQDLGASVVYDNGQINATGNGTEISLQIGSTQATVNGQTETIDVAPFIVGASTYVPLRFVSQALGASVNYDDSSREVSISMANQPDQNSYQPNDQNSYQNDQAPSFADTGYQISEPPPPLPYYDQPPVPEPNYIWQPGCWAWGGSGYYWVPGTWVPAPQPNLLWTPGYWSFSIGGFGWHPGYWATQVGFYGGIAYGGGYFGHGYDGGRWDNDRFRYNSAVTNVTNVTNTTIIKNVYVNKTVVNNYNDTTVNRTSYNGGPNGTFARPTASELAVNNLHHVAPTPIQRQHAQIAAQDRRLLATVNDGKPPLVVAPRPLTPETKPAEFVPVTPDDKAAADRLVVHPNVTHPNPVMRPDVVRPDVVKPEVTKPDVVHPDVPRPEVTRPDVVRPYIAPPEVVHPETARPEMVRPVQPPIERPQVQPPVMRPQVVRPPVVNPPVFHPQVMHPQVVRPPVVHPPVVHPPAYHPAPKPHPAPPKPDHPDHG